MFYFKAKYTIVAAGTEGFMLSFFSTINTNLENDIWGSRYPLLMNDFCDNLKVSYKDLDAFEQEIMDVKNKLSNLDSTHIVLDYKDKSKKIDFSKIGIDVSQNLNDAYKTIEGQIPMTDQILLQIAKCRKGKYDCELLLLK